MKESATDERLVFTVNLQSVMTCPKLLASQNYYILKLQVHNFTLHALNDKKVDRSIRWWLALINGCEFTSCLIDYLGNPMKKSFIKTKIKHSSVL